MTDGGLLRFAKDPQDLTVREGDRITLVARAEGADSLTYRWQKDGSDAPGVNNEATYVIERAAPSDAGAYAVIAFANGEIMSETATVVVRGQDAGGGQESPAPSTTPPAPAPSAPAAEPKPPPPILEWDAAYGWIALLGLAVVLGLCLFATAWGLHEGFKKGTPEAHAFFIEVTLASMGVFSLTAAVYAVALELRGRSRRQLPAPAPGPDKRSLPGDAVKTLPEILKAFADLPVASALMVMSGVFLGGATALAWNALP